MVFFGIIQTGIDIQIKKEQLDQAVPPSSGSVFDLGGGFIIILRMFTWVCLVHITEPTIETDDGDIPLERHYFLIAGYYYF